MRARRFVLNCASIISTKVGRFSGDYAITILEKKETLVEDIMSRVKSIPIWEL